MPYLPSFSHSFSIAPVFWGGEVGGGSPTNIGIVTRHGVGGDNSGSGRRSRHLSCNKVFISLTQH